MARTKRIKIEKEVVEEAAEGEPDTTDLVSLFDDPQIAKLLGSSTIREDFDRKELIGFLRLLRAEQEKLEEEGRSLSFEDIIAAKIRNMYCPADKFPPRKSTP